MFTQDLVSLAKTVEELVVECGEYAFSKWKTLTISSKGLGGDIVTDVDREIERIISSKLVFLIDGAEVVGEEAGGNFDAEWVWLVDPIDGTKHYAHLMPSYFIQVALLHNNKPVMGILYEPVTKQLFSAVKGGGAFLNGEKITLPISPGLDKSVIDVDFGGVENLDWKIKALKKLAENSYRVRMSGGRFAPYLLTGGIHVFVVLNPTTKKWDQAPRMVLFTEAGYNILQGEKNGYSYMIAGHKKDAHMMQVFLESID